MEQFIKLDREGKAQYRNYVFTCNNYTDAHEELVKSLKHQYLVYGYEEAPTTKTKHLQGYIVLKGAKTLSAMKKSLPGFWLDVAKCRTHEIIANYCKKGGVYVEIGDFPKQGERTDLIAIRKKINEEGITMRDIIPVCCTNLQQIKLCETLMKYYEPPRNWKPLVKWYFGNTDCGKSRMARETLPDAYYTMCTSRWWDGYDGHKDVIIDDFRESWIKFSDLLRLLDRYECRIETKGGTRQLRAENMIITSPKHPKYYYLDEGEDINQLLRRIDHIIEFLPNGEINYIK